MTDMPLLEVKGLTKRYKALTAVDGIDLSITRGTCFGLLGPNGAGKTTTVEMMEGITAPTAGEILFEGLPQGAKFRQAAGIQFQHTALQEFLTVRENINYFSSLYSKTANMDELIQFCHLQDYMDQDANKLSGGQKQRMLLAIALLNDPKLVFLDEPTTGLDPQARRNFWDLIQTLKQRGKTVVLTTHYMEEAYQLCDRIAIMDHGRIIAEGSPDALLAEHFTDVVLSFDATTFPSEARHMPHQIRPGTKETLEISTRDVNETVGELIALGVDLSGMSIRQRSLEDLFLTLTGKEIRQ